MEMFNKITTWELIHTLDKNNYEYRYNKMLDADLNIFKITDTSPYGKIISRKVHTFDLIKAIYNDKILRNIKLILSLKYTVINKLNKDMFSKIASNIRHFYSVMIALSREDKIKYDRKNYTLRIYISSAYDQSITYVVRKYILYKVVSYTPINYVNSYEYH
jgi:hypothetical protein